MPANSAVEGTAGSHALAAAVLSALIEADSVPSPTGYMLRRAQRSVLEPTGDMGLKVDLRHYPALSFTGRLVTSRERVMGAKGRPFRAKIGAASLRVFHRS